MAIWSLGFRRSISTGSGVPNVYELQARAGCSGRLIEVGIPTTNTGVAAIRVYPSKDPQGLTAVALRFDFEREDDIEGPHDISPVQCLIPAEDGHATQWRRDSAIVAAHRRKQMNPNWLGVVWVFPRGLVINDQISVVLQTSGNYDASDVWFVVEA